MSGAHRFGFEHFSQWLKVRVPHPRRVFVFAARVGYLNFNKRTALALAGLLCLVASGCHAPGKPGPEPEVVRPEEVQDFAVLYKQNCVACHGDNGQHGIAVSLANPVYLSVAGRQVIIDTASKGVHGQLMPAFAKSRGGTLTDRQIEILADGILSHWGNPRALGGATPPPYAATLTGDPTAGQMNFHFYCARCHETPIKPGPKGALASVDAGPITDPSYLALISDQGLRSIILSGRPEEGMPDWRTFAPAPLTDQDVTDIVAWLASQRKSAPGQPYPERPSGESR
jgi:cytochrome c oxidase cbb3-type subunit 3/ubiquinol-cytochrome c reductase cytochrome c subunit